ncbi:stAR-related lipid transfer protein 7, mitochondrial-like [Zingiber officinale]|uniref:START domain-containing protein n=1 Tax=Zingiber officinale TaxID=94328 RepID=A0A8J5HY45_ZINOF|nr:stAR-related lipid transfer protein 7, mitochondrial-like [Zingiber officinale]KAG6538616.1 hypothetical protein ZIOFF_003740 [Zingiber officinale]
MVLILDVFLEILWKPLAADVAATFSFFVVPICVAVITGVLLGWAWRPGWVTGLLGANSESRRLPVADYARSSGPNMLAAEAVDTRADEKLIYGSQEPVVTDEDLEHLFRLVEETDGGQVWQKMMDKSLPNMTYQAWKREPKTGPPQYRSSTIYEDTAPETLREFFWDDDFRIKNGWDDMLLQYTTLKECMTTGTMVVQWVRKFPFFCSDREYIIGRRIWESGQTYYCITKGVPCSTVPRRNKPRRVDVYYSSWCIRAAESKRDGQMTACEILLFHHEDMGIPWEIAKLGVRQGMWGCVKKIEPGLRAYQAARRSGEPLSHFALMSHINTNFDAVRLSSLESSTGSSADTVEAEKPKSWASNIPRYLIVGGAVAVACSLDHGLLTKAVIFGVARRFAGIGRKS